MYKQNPNSPVLKALKGNQGKLPQALQDVIKAAPESPANQTTAGEFAHKQSIKDKEMGGSTKALDKFTSALEAPFSDKTYGELKKEKRAKQKAKHNAKSPAKQTKEEASAYMDGLREKRAKKAEKSGDKGRAQRIRSTKDSQDGVESPAKQTKRRVPPAPKAPVGPKAKKPKTKKEEFEKKVNKKRYK